MNPIKITSGALKGYYTMQDASQPDASNTFAKMEATLRQAAGGRGLAWYKYSPGAGKTIQGFNQTYLPLIGGFYYVPVDPAIDVRRQLYALENKLVPADGNTETFNLELAKVHVPPDWCPVYLDPCPPGQSAWCKQCKSRFEAQPAVALIDEIPLAGRIHRWLMITMFCFILAFVFTFFVVYG